MAAPGYDKAPRASHRSERLRIAAALVAISLTLPVGWSLLQAQIAASSDDPTGISIAYPRVHLIHSRETTVPGTTGHLRRHDPFLLYQLGRDLLNRQFTLAEGAYGQAGQLTVPLYVGDPDQLRHGVPARFARDHASSCGFCHQNPYREPGGGQTIGSTGGAGRNSTHFFGSGLMEMLAAQTRTLLHDRYDTDRNGVFDRAELTGPRPAWIEPTEGASRVDFGDLAPGPDGVPRLNSAFRLWYLDSAGRVLPRAVGFSDPAVAAFDFAFEPFGWGRGTRTVDGRRVAQGGEAATIREFFTGAADVHMGLQADDPSQISSDPAAFGFGGPAQESLSGAQQFDFGGAVDRGRKRAETGLSLDDPDGDGVLSELTEGDVDAVEFYMLHAPPPTVRATATSENGRAVLVGLGCTRCHVETWEILPQDTARGLPGDRRLFHLAAGSALEPDGYSRLTAQLIPLHRPAPGGGVEPQGKGFRVERIYTDFKHWDLGDGFAERRFDGSLQREHRTAPLWGAGTSAPYGHAGQFADLDAVIAAHGGAAAAEGDAYRALPVAARRQVTDYLESLVLYATDEIPADLDGDGQVNRRFQVAGRDVGYERFDARFLFAQPVRVLALDTVESHRPYAVPLFRVENLDRAFGLELAARRDLDGDGFPDLLDPAPDSLGVVPDGPDTSP